MRLIKRLSLLVMAGVLPTGCGGGEDPIHIGLAGPLEQPRGRSMEQAAQLAVSEVNARGGIRGRPLLLELRDDSASAEAAVRAARELYDTPDLVAVIGHLTSGATIAAAPVYNGGSRPVLQISPSASSPEVSRAGPYTFRVCPSDLVHGERLADWARTQLGAARAAVIYLNDDYGRGVRSTFGRSFTTMEGEVVTEDPYVAELPTFEPYLRRIQARGGADALMIAGTRPGAERIIATMESLGISYPVLGGDGLAGLEHADVDAEGVYVSAAYLPDRPGAQNEAFVAAYQEAYGADQFPDHRGAGAYDIVHLLARALEAVGTDREALRDYIAGVGSETRSHLGVTGTIAFDENGDVPEKRVMVGVVRDGRLIMASRR
jgi:branched-chain amino acid transport system substrate-binding protein